MRTKSYTVAATIVIYCAILVCLKPSQAISSPLPREQAHITDHSRVSREPESHEEVPPSCDPLLAETIGDFNAHLSLEATERLARQIEGTANMYGVDPYLVTALVSQESAFSQNAVSPVGALGLGQLMPETAADLGVNPHDPEQNLDGCVRYLAQNLEQWSSTEDPVALALASYNAGPGAVQRYGGVPPYEETQHYVAVIKYRYDLLRSGRSLTG